MAVIEIPEKVNTILCRLQDAGYEAYIVGGCVRDALLGRTPHDWDITTSALPAEVKALFPRTVDTGLKHGTVTVMIEREGFEVTTYRIDGVYEDARHPREVTFTRNLEEDLKRRDFTINAMAYSERDGLVDLFGGQEDLDRRIVRAVGDPVQRFSEDALRIMRAIRFSAQLGYEIDPLTLSAAGRLAPNLQKISAERIREELEKTLVSAHPQKLRVAWEKGITAQFLPEFDRCMETPQNNPHHCYCVGDHILHSVCFVRPDKVLRLTMLLHDIDKPSCRTTDENGVDHFYGHAESGALTAGRILRRLRYDNETREKVTKLVKYHDLDIHLTPAGVRKAIVRVGKDLFPLLLEVKQADMLAQSTYERDEKQQKLERIRELYRQILERGDCLDLRSLAVSGGDLLAAGMQPGSAVGECLQEMLMDVIAQPQHNDKDYLLRRYCRV